MWHANTQPDTIIVPNVHILFVMFKATTAAEIMLHRPKIRILNATKTPCLRDSQPSRSAKTNKLHAFSVFGHDVFIYTTKPSDAALKGLGFRRKV
jgi:hypothetical protein